MLQGSEVASATSDPSPAPAQGARCADPGSPVVLPPGFESGPDPDVPGVNAPSRPGAVAPQATEFYGMPAGCPRVADPRARLAAWVGPDALQRICSDAMALSVSYEAESAIRWAFGRLGTPYSQSAGQRTTSTSTARHSWAVPIAPPAPRPRCERCHLRLLPVLHVDRFLHRCDPSDQLDRRRSRGDQRPADLPCRAGPGDIVIKFAGGDPIASAGNAGHAQLYLGNDWVIEAGGKQDYSNVDIGRMSFDPDTPTSGTSATTPWAGPSGTTPGCCPAGRPTR